MLHQLLLPLLGSLLLLTPTITAQSGNIVRFNFRFGFFDDDQTPLADIMKEDVEGVLCQTQYFLSQIVQNATDSKSVHAKATQVDWGYYEGQDLPAHINFTVEYSDSTIEGDVNWIDDQILITEMEGLSSEGLQDYITKWVWESEPKKLNFFTNANRMAFDGLEQAPVTGQLEEAECPDTEAPTIAPTSSVAPTGAPTTLAEANDANPDGSPNDGGPSGAAGSPNIGGFDGPGGNGGDPNGGDPNANDPNAPGGQRAGDWPFGPNYNGLDDVQPMADFSLSFSMFEDHETPPTVAEVNALMCEVNNYFTEELRRKLLNGTVHMKAVYIDYYFEEGGAGSAQEDIRVNFTAFAYYGADEHDQLPVTDVFEAMKLNNVELKTMVENYVWKSEPEQENVFFHTESLGLNAGMGKPISPEAAMLVEADGCILLTNDDGSAFAGVGGPNSGEGGPPASPVDRGAAFGDPNLGLGGNAKQTEITTNFRVSNLENIKEENAVKASGLDSSFPVFTNEMVSEMTQRDAAARRVLRNGRVLRVVPIPGTSTVNEVQEYPCPDSALPGLTCHSARAKYDVLMSSDEDTAQVQSDYTAASEKAVNDGTYNNVLQRIDPDSPLYIGIMTSKDQIPPGSVKRGYDGEPDDDEDGWFKWWYILILLLLLLLCCLCCLYCWMLNNKDEPVKETTIEEREVLVEEFEDEDVDHGAPGDDDSDEDEEEFIDDPANAGAMVPYDPDGDAPVPAPAPAVVETGVLVPFDPEASKKAHEDQSERDRILNTSNREKTKEEDDDQVWEEDV